MPHDQAVSEIDAGLKWQAENGKKVF